MIRDHETLQVSAYADRLPEDLNGRQVFVLDPMLATGNTLVMAIEYLRKKGARDITCVCLLAAPEGIKHVEEELTDSDIPVKIVVGTIDERLNEKGYIVPGLGDAGDRLYGVV
jgi:uracil phosphoribosyltransferase